MRCGKGFLLFVALIVSSGCAAVQTSADKASNEPILSDVSAWAIQLQGIEEPGAIERLESAAVDLVVICPKLEPLFE